MKSEWIEMKFIYVGTWGGVVGKNLVRPVGNVLSGSSAPSKFVWENWPLEA